MEKEFTLIEQSIDLHRLGFEEPCIRGWSTDGELFYHPDSDVTVDNPTYSQAFRFFREKHGLYTSGADTCFDEGEREYFYHDIYDKNDIEVYSSEVNYNSWEEAEKECLKKLIEIAQKEK